MSRSIYSMSEVMRSELAKVGITLDPPKPILFTPPPKVHVPDREGIREILIERGARARDIDWLESSCPSVEAAKKFTPPKVI